MSQFPSQFEQNRPWSLEYGADDRAVFNFFNAVYAWMFVGLAVTASVAYAGSQSPAMLQMIYAGRGVMLVGGLVAFAIAWGVQSAAHRISPTAATMLFLLYAAVVGVLISYVFVIYEMSILISSFVITGGVFGGMSLYGYFTKRDLTSMGSILIMCAWGLLLASVVNIFFASNALSWIITYAVLAVFIGLTAYDTQKLKEMAHATQGDATMAARYAIVGSLHLYVDFINIFLAIARILGSRR